MKGQHDRAGRILTFIRYALWDLIFPEESVQLIAQFPMYLLLKKVFINGWTIYKTNPKVASIPEIIAMVRNEIIVMLEHLCKWKAG